MIKKGKWTVPGKIEYRYRLPDQTLIRRSGYKEKFGDLNLM